MFSSSIFRVFAATFMAVAIFEGSSVIITISAVSMAASEPMQPMAIPISAPASTDAYILSAFTALYLEKNVQWRVIKCL